METHRIGIIMNGVTGRMGTNQHLLRSIAAIIEQGGVHLGPNEIIMPDPILVGRNEDKLKALCARSGVEKWSTDLDVVLADDSYGIYFDSQTTGRRADGVRKAVKAGKSIYCEKPTAVDSKTALELYQLCKDAGIKNGVVQDKLWLPGMLKVDDSAYATFELENGVIAHFNSSWNVRVRRDDLLTLQIDGTKGSAVAGLRDVKIQHYGNTPKPTWNPDIAQPIDFYEGWADVPEQELYDNAFKVQWKMFLRHVVKDEPFPFTLLEGAKGVQLAELGIKSWEERRWIDVPDLA